MLRLLHVSRDSRRPTTSICLHFLMGDAPRGDRQQATLNQPIFFFLTMVDGFYYHAPSPLSTSLCPKMERPFSVVSHTPPPCPSPCPSRRSVLSPTQRSHPCSHNPLSHNPRPPAQARHEYGPASALALSELTAMPVAPPVPAPSAPAPSPPPAQAAIECLGMWRLTGEARQATGAWQTAARGPRGSHRRHRAPGPAREASAADPLPLCEAGRWWRGSGPGADGPTSRAGRLGSHHGPVGTD